MKSRHPIQPIETDAKGVQRFKRNAIVEYLLEKSGVNINDIMASELSLGISFTDADREQLVQLLGWDLAGFPDLQCVSDETYEIAQQVAADPNTHVEQARIAILEYKLTICKQSVKTIAATLFRITQEDLIDA